MLEQLTFLPVCVISGRMDLVADGLEISGVRGTIGARIEAGGSWSIPVTECTTTVLHVVTAGRVLSRCWMLGFLAVCWDVVEPGSGPVLRPLWADR